VHDLFTLQGATNAVWVWVVMGWEPALDRAEALWPGREYVDWVSWEAYNPSGCRAGEVEASRWISFEEAMLTGFDWLHSGDAAVARDLPIMISEAGTSHYPDNPRHTADWYAQIPATLRKYPQIKAVGLWDHTGTGKTCDFRFGADPTVRQGIARMAADPWVNSQAPAADD
jgi:hypothetical protein